MKIVYLIFGHIFLTLGVIGIFLPILPTTPFILLAAFFYSRSSNYFHQLILQNKIIGPAVLDWEKNKIISIKAKIIAASTLIFVLFYKIPKLNIHYNLKIFIALIISFVLLYILTRKSKNK